MHTFPLLVFVIALFALCSSSARGATQPQEVSLGTTLVAVCFDGGVVVGADTRTSVGSYVSNRYATKIASIVEGGVVICRSGSAADTQLLADRAKWKLRERTYRYGLLEEHDTSMSVRQVARLLRSLMLDESSEKELVASLICAGYDADEDCGRLYSISQSGSLMEEGGGYTASGSGSSYILGYLDREYRENMSKEEAADFVTTAVQLAMARDGSSGGVVRLVVLTKGGQEERLVIASPKRSQQPQEGSVSPKSLPGFASPLHRKKG